jgi:hypothetical protein
MNQIKAQPRNIKVLIMVSVIYWLDYLILLRFASGSRNLRW